ncbi:head-tail connector protein [Vibrio coralliilyticus]|uniref:head-tail connector protein n=1 Tax=Vibrio coralliilyticus TaxID=190893 RepID=UPI0017B6F4E2|nr:head-tail connector protein [Vibrio coralliilyticus]NUW66954.1 phage gp6-like head-tail connector protein [Vibrio coralliilyticus]
MATPRSKRQAQSLPFLTLDTVKRHLKVDADLTEEDTLIEQWMASAVTACEDRLCRSLSEVKAEYGHIPAPLVSWILCAVAELYQHRGLSTERKVVVNAHIDRLIDPYVDYARGR